MTPAAATASTRDISQVCYRALFTALAAIVVTLAGGAADSHSAPSSPPLVLVADTAMGEGSSAIGGRVRIEARFRTWSSGTFQIGGAISDTGTLKAVRRVAGGRVQLTEVLTGELGTIRIRATHPCTGRSGTWQVLSGSRAYKGLSGGGVGRGGPRCTAARYPVRAIYAGTVRTPAPPPPLAQPGRYGGGTSQSEEVVFEVAPGGRMFGGLTLQRLTARCSPTLTILHTISLPELYEIADDGSFALQSVLPSGMTQSVTGRFTSSATAAGSASISQTVTDPTNNTRYTCSGSVTWTASLPPPSAQPGRYCGFTHQGPGICLDVAPNGRELTGFESGVVVRCFPGGVPPSEVEITLTFSGSMPIGGHLGFSGRGIPVEGLVSGTAGITGLFQSTGTASGTVSLGPATLDHEGTRYQCHPAVGRWDARR